MLEEWADTQYCVFCSNVYFLLTLETLKALAELQFQKQQTTRYQEEVSVLQRRYEDKCMELTSFLGKYEDKSKQLEQANVQLQAQQLSNRYNTGCSSTNERWLLNEQWV